MAFVMSVFPAWAAEDHLPGPIEARVLKVIDGDTITVRARIWLRQEVETNVRVAGIDTPEKKGKCPEERELAQRAQALVEERLAGGVVRLRDVAFEKYGGRVVADIELPGGERLADLILAANLARPYGGGAKAPWCAELSER